MKQNNLVIQKSFCPSFTVLCQGLTSVSSGQISSAVCSWHAVGSVHNSDHGSRRENQVPFTGKELAAGDSNLMLVALTFHTGNFLG